MAPVPTTVSGYVENTSRERVAGAAVALIGERSVSNRETDTVTTGPDGAFGVTVPRGNLVYGLRVVCEGHYLKDIESTGRVDLAASQDGTRPPSATRTQDPRASAEKDAWNRDHLTLPLQVPAGGLHDVVVTLTRATRISGRVVDAQRRPVKDVYVRCGSVDGQRIDGADRPLVSFQKETAKPTDEQGQFVLGNLTPDHYVLWGRYAPLGGDDASLPCVPLGSPESPLLELTLCESEWIENLELRAPLDDGRSIEGSVVDRQGDGIEGARVSALMTANSAAGVTASPTSRTGAFRIDRILVEHPALQAPHPIDKVRLRAECQGFEPLTVEDVAVGARGVRLTMGRERRGAIAVRLRDAGSGETVRDATVRLWRTDTAWGENRIDKTVLSGDPAKAVKPNGLGWFLLESVPAGVSELVVKARGYGIKQHGGVVVQEGKTTKVDLPLEGAGLICARTLIPDVENGWTVGSEQPTCAPVADANATQGTADERLFAKASDCPPGSLSCPLKTNEEPPDRHQDFVVSPGRYLVKFRLTLQKRFEDPFAQPPVLALIRRCIPVTAVSGTVSTVESNLSFDGSGSVDVAPPPDRYLVELFMGDSLPLRSFRGREMLDTATDTTEYHRMVAENQHVVFPCVMPGNYVVACTPLGRLADPVTKDVTVVAGQTVTVAFK